MAYNINDTVTMLAALKQTLPPSTFLLDTFFPNVLPPFTTAEVDMEYKKGGRKMAVEKWLRSPHLAQRA